MTVQRPRVLIVLDYYLPGVNAGGPVRSIANLIEHLADEADFLVATQDRDLGEDRPYAGISHDEWMPVGRARVRYMRPRVPGAMLSLARKTPHDVLYLSSYFSPSSIELVWARRAGISTGARCIVAPRGQFGGGALATKSFKKRALLNVSNRLGVHAGVTWHATNAAEAEQIQRVVRPEGEIIVASNLPSVMPEIRKKTPKIPGELHMVTVARVHPIKNILKAIEWLAGVQGSIRYDVFGPHEDREYLAECRRAAARLPAQIRVQFPGALPHAEVARRLADYDLFVLPTQGENFGHSIGEALAAGVPVLVSDRTPWRGLEPSGAGWDLPLEEPERFQETLRSCVAMDAIGHAAKSDAARRIARDGIARITAEAITAYRQMFLPRAGTRK